MMSLRGLANPLTSTVNPNVKGDAYISQGSTTGYGGKRTPSFEKVEDRTFQVQALSGGELRHADSLNIQGVKRGVYMDGTVNGVRRRLGKGGDILAFGGSYWLIVDVPEPWDGDGWCKVIVAEQTNPPEGF